RFPSSADERQRRRVAHRIAQWKPGSRSAGELRIVRGRARLFLQPRESLQSRGAAELRRGRDRDPSHGRKRRAHGEHSLFAGSEGSEKELCKGDESGGGGAAGGGADEFPDGAERLSEVCRCLARRREGAMGTGACGRRTRRFRKGAGTRQQTGGSVAGAGVSGVRAIEMGRGAALSRTGSPAGSGGFTGAVVFRGDRELQSWAL